MIVPPEGPRDARLVIVGEAPGPREAEVGKPFVGPSGHRLDGWLAGIGLPRPLWYVCNVLDEQPQPHIDAITRAEGELAIERLYQRIAGLTPPDDAPRVIVPLGNYALYALTGKGKVSWHLRDGRHPRPGIHAHRGSLYEYQDRRGRGWKVVPTFHPAWTFRVPLDERVVVEYDLPRIAYEAQTPGRLALPRREHFIQPTLEDVRGFTQDALRAPALALDIETPMEVSWQTIATPMKTCTCGHAQTRHGTPSGPCGVRKCPCPLFGARQKTRRAKVGATPYVGCVGFAPSSNFSFTIPTTLEYWRSELALMEVWNCVARICDAPGEKILQNGGFDTYWLAHAHGIALRNWRWDTRAMHHILEPALQHDLAFLCSIYTRQPYYKDECKDPDEVQKYATNSEALWTYNGIDCCVTYEAALGPRAPACAIPLRSALETSVRTGAYDRLVASRLEPLRRMALRGLRVDQARRITLQTRLRADAAAIGAVFNTTAGCPLVVNTGISTQRLAWLLYGAKGVAANVALRLAATYPGAKPLNLPPLYAKRGKRAAKTVSVDEVSLRRLMLSYPARMGDLDLAHILEYRRLLKMAQRLDTTLDSDGRMRCQYGLITSTGRLTSAATPMRTGTNLQNEDRGLRDVYVPEERI